MKCVLLIKNQNFLVSLSEVLKNAGVEQILPLLCRKRRLTLKFAWGHGLEEFV